MLFPKDKGFKHEAYGAGDVQALLKNQEIRDQKKQTKLPDVTTEDNGKVLSVVEGNWDKAQPTNELPDVTEDDNGNILSVVEGVWAKAAPAGGGDTVIFELEHPSGNNYYLKDGTLQSIYDAIVYDKKIPVLIFPYSGLPGTTISNYRIFYFTGISGTSRFNFEQIYSIGSDSITALQIIRLSFLRSELSSNAFDFKVVNISIQ